MRIKDRDYDVAELRRIWRELEDGPDATYVTVEETDSKVRIGKRGRYLHMEAKEHGKGGEDMEARIPLRWSARCSPAPARSSTSAAAAERPLRRR